jgi:hypothetical protein
LPRHEQVTPLHVADSNFSNLYLMPWCVPAPQAVHGIALFFRFMLLSSSSASSVLSSLPSSRQGSFRGITPRLVSRNMGVSNWLRTN